MIDWREERERLTNEEPVAPVPKGRQYKRPPDRVRIEVSLGDMYAPCVGCGKVYNVTMRFECPECRCKR